MNKTVRLIENSACISFVRVYNEIVVENNTSSHEWCG